MIVLFDLCFLFFFFLQEILINLLQHISLRAEGLVGVKGFGLLLIEFHTIFIYFTGRIRAEGDYLLTYCKIT